MSARSCGASFARQNEHLTVLHCQTARESAPIRCRRRAGVRARLAVLPTASCSTAPKVRRWSTAATRRIRAQPWPWSGMRSGQRSWTWC
jgi:hypothetical protein